MLDAAMGLDTITAALVLLTWIASACARAVPASNAASRVVQDTSESIIDLVKPYPLEEHFVITEDGYILTLYRVPHGIKPPTTSNHAPGSHHSLSLSPRPVAFLQHGLLDSCAGFLLAGHDAALAFLLADAGYDVWLGNSRGSTHSRGHVHLPITSAEFWSFSFDEMAQYDLPAMLKHVRDRTGAPRVSYISHSQGGTIMLAALASQPDLAQYLQVAILMAPVAYARHVTSLPLSTLAALGTDGMFTLLGVHEFMPSVQVMSWLEGQLCTFQPDMCISILAAICGYRRGAVNETRLPLYLKYTPAGSSVQNIAHWAQLIRGGNSPGRPEMTYFDYGTNCGTGARQRTCNQQQYGTRVPPVYKLGSISKSMRLALFTGGQDRLADAIDMELLLEALPPGVVVHHQHDPDLEHLDYIWGVDMTDRVYTPVMRLLQQAYSDGSDTAVQASQ